MWTCSTMTLFKPITMLRGTDNIPRNIPLYFPHSNCGTQYLGSFLGTIGGQDPSKSKSSRLVACWHLASFLYSRHILQIPLKRSVYFLKCWTSTNYSSNSTGSSFFYLLCLRQKADMPAAKHMWQMTMWQVLCHVKRSTAASATNRRFFPYIGGIVLHNIAMDLNTIHPR